MYDSYEVEYLPNEGVLSTGRHLFVEFTTDGTMTSTGAAIRYEGRLIMQMTNSSLLIYSDILQFLVFDVTHFLSPKLLQKGCATSPL